VGELYYVDAPLGVGYLVAALGFAAAAPAGA
jgi:hypothetical protein